MNKENQNNLECRKNGIKKWICMYLYILQAGVQKVLGASDFSLFTDLDIIVTAQMTVCVATLCRYRLMNAHGYLLGITLLKEEEKRVKDRSFLEKWYRKCLVSADNLIAWSSLCCCFRPNGK